MPEGPRWSEYMVVRELVPALRNAKGHADEVIDASINRFGLIESIVLDERTGRMVGGHGRRKILLAKEEAGEDPPDGVVVTPEGWKTLVNRGWASKDDDEAEAAAVALNRTGEVGGWHTDILADILGGVAATPAGLDGTGYDLSELDGMRASYVPPVEPEPAAPVEPRQVQGLHEVILVYQAETHREYMEHLAVLRSRWAEDVTGLVVLRALREAAARRK